jgi:hypothetical protein
MKKFLMLATASSLALYMTACSDNSTSADDEPLKPGSVYAFASDAYAGDVGELYGVDDDKLSGTSLEFYQDTKIIGLDGNLFVLERKGKDNLTLVDVSENKAKWQKKLDKEANPSDLVKANKDEVWVSYENVAKIVKVSVKNGEITKTINTDKFCQGEALSPNLVDLEVSGDTLFALFGRSENYNFKVPALLAMYKLDNGDLLDTIRLAKKNPMAMGFTKGKLYVASAGEWNLETYHMDADDTRGIEVVDFAKKSSSMVVDGKKLGGGVWNTIVLADGIAYAPVIEQWGSVSLAEVDLAEKSVKKISGVDDVESLAYDEATGVLYIGDRGSKAALYAYEDGKLNKIEAPKDMLPVYNITIVR